MNWLKRAISTGAFEEQTAEDDGSCSTLCENDLDWLKTAISTGAFEEQTAEDDGSCSTLCENDLDQYLENPGHQSVVSHPLADNEAVG